MITENLRTDVTDFSHLSVDTQRESEPGSERQDDLDAFTLNAAERGERRVVDDAHVTIGSLSQDVFERKAAPLRLEIWINLGRESTGT